jgi:glycosyltransferase involved in cell wall biosynthesis
MAAYAGLPAGDAGPEVLYVGTLAPWQGLEVLVRALADLPPPTRLRLIGPPGKGWARGLRKLAAGLGVADRLTIWPAIAPGLVPGAIARARVCVAPLDGSARNLIQGCCPLKLLEYAAGGKAIVASAVPPVEALFAHDQDAWLVPPDDPRALAAGLGRLLADPPLRERLGAAARAKAAAMSWEASNAKVLAAYAELGVT